MVRVLDPDFPLLGAYLCLIATTAAQLNGFSAAQRIKVVLRVEGSFDVAADSRSSYGPASQR
jgi:hypothetical protein